MAELKPWGSGDPDQRVAIYKPADGAVPDAYNLIDLNDPANWTLVCSRWMRVLNTAAGREPTVADQVIALENFAVWFRWEPDLPIDPTWRLKLRSRYWNILAAANWGEKNRWYKLICCERRS